MVAENSSLIRKPTTNSKNRKSDKNKPNKHCLKKPLLNRLSSAAAITTTFLKTNDLYLPPSHSLLLQSLLSSLPIPPSPSLSSTWFNRFVTSATEPNDPRWTLNFRMSKPTFFNLFTTLNSPSLPLPSFAAAIFRLAHNASYKALMTRFGFDSVANASRSFYTVCKLVNEKLAFKDDVKPDYSPTLLPNCCGVLGFGRFEVDDKLLGSNGSLVVQALIDSSGRFVDVSAGWPSTMKLEAVFRQTRFFLEAERLLEGALCKLGNGVSVPRYVLGDVCLPLLPWVVTPYEDGLEVSCRREFNSVVESELRNVEIAFGKVRGKWRIFGRKWKLETMEFLPFVVTTGCLLHNFLVDCGEGGDLQEECVYGSGEGKGEMMKAEEEEMRRSEGEADVASRKIRDAIAKNLSRVRSTK